MKENLLQVSVKILIGIEVPIEPIAAKCKLPLAHARVLSIASRANAYTRFGQSERLRPVPRELFSRLSGQRRILTHIGASR